METLKKNLKKWLALFMAVVMVMTSGVISTNQTFRAAEEDESAEASAPVGEIVVEETPVAATFAVTYQTDEFVTVEGASTVNADETLSITVTPVEGYEIAEVTATSGSVQTDETPLNAAKVYTVTGIDADTVITVASAMETYDVTYVVTPTAGAIVLGEEEATRGDALTFEVQPTDGYEIASVIANGTELTSSSEEGTTVKSYTLENITADTTVEITMNETVDHPAFEQSVTVEDGTTITVSAVEGVLPAGTQLSATLIESNLEGTEKDGEIVKSVSYDVTLLTAEGNALSNENWTGFVSVNFVGPVIEEVSAEAETVEILHTDDEGTTTTEATVDVTDTTISEVECTTTHFSIFTVAGTTTVSGIVTTTGANIPNPIYVGDSITIYTNKTTTSNGTWSTSKKSIISTATHVNVIVKDNNGNNQSRPAVTITAKQDGTATITYEYWNDGWKTDSVTITVKKANTNVTSVVLDPTEAEIMVGNTQQLTATVEMEDKTVPSAKVTWKSSNTSVATVDENGLVTAIAKGTATITATAGSKSVTSTITVPETYSVSFNKNSGMEGAGSIPSITASKGDTIKLPTEGFTRSGYTLVGFATNSGYQNDGGYKDNTIYYLGQDYIVQSSVTLYAVWASTTDTDVEFYIRKDGTIPTEPQGHEASEYSAAINITGAIKAGYAYFQTDSTNGVNDALSKVPTDEQIKAVYSDYDPNTHYVLWYVIKKESTWHVDGVLLEKAKLNVSYNANCPAGEWSNMPDGYQLYKDNTVIVGASSNNANNVKVPTRVGYDFVGWNTTADGTGTSYSNNDTFALTEAITLYAQWQPKNSIPYTIYRYDKDTGEQIGTSITNYGKTGSSVTVADTYKQIQGYRFVENYSENVLSGTVKGDGSLVLKLYFQQLHSVTYNWGDTTPDGVTLPTDEKSYVNGETYEVNGDYTETSTVTTYDQYGNVNGEWTFSGWTDPNNRTMDTDGVEITGSWTYTANVNYEKYNVTYAFGEGSPAETASLVLPTDTAEYALNQPYNVSNTTYEDINIDDGNGNVEGTWTFNGWTDTNEANSGKMVENGVTITGSWTFKPSVSNTEYIEVSDPADTVYNGQEQKQPVTVTDVTTGAELVQGVDYDITYSPATNVGLVTVTITGKGDYVGTVTAEYRITPATVTVTAADATKHIDSYTGTTDPEFTATVTGLVNGESTDLIDYTLGRNAGETAGEYTITPTGAASQGNYAVTYVPAQFTITTEVLIHYVYATDNTPASEDRFVVLNEENNYTYNIASPAIEGFTTRGADFVANAVDKPQKEYLEITVLYYTVVVTPEPTTDPTVDPTPVPTEPTPVPLQATVNPEGGVILPPADVATEGQGAQVEVNDDGTVEVVTVEDTETPLSNFETVHKCNILPFLFVLLALLVMVLFTHDAKKRQKHIQELKEELELRKLGIDPKTLEAVQPTGEIPTEPSPVQAD